MKGLGDAVPGVVVETGETNISGAMFDPPTAYHLDDVDDIKYGDAPVYIYIWESERAEREQELHDELDTQKQDYRFPTGIVYSEALRDLVPLSGEQLAAYAWAVQLGFWEAVEDGADAERMIEEMNEHLSD